MAGSHPHLVGVIGCCTLPENPVCLVLEYMPGGDLLGYLHKIRETCSLQGGLRPFQSLGSRNNDHSEFFSKIIFIPLADS